VEAKGYKNVINLPDWIYLQNIIDKLKKKCENDRIYLHRVPAKYYPGA